MDMKWIGSVPLLLLVLAISPDITPAQEIAAEDAERSGEERCAGNNQWAYVAGMGLVDDDRLQEHVDEVRAELDDPSASLPRSRQQRKSMERHLERMQQAMGEMQATITDGACDGAMTAAPVDQRVQLLEQRLDGMQKMLERLVAQQESLGRE